MERAICPALTFEIGLLLGLAVLVVVLFSLDRFPSDVVALGFMVTLVLTGILPTEKAFAGFGSDTVILILGLLVLTSAMEQTGVMELAGRVILRWTGKGPNSLLLTVMLASAGLGSFMSNTAATAFFLPVVVGVAKKAKIPRSKLLMPLAFASILSSSVTLISTSTNLVISGLMKQSGMAGMGFFELAPVGIPIAGAGLAYMFFLGRYLIGGAKPEEGGTGLTGFRPYLAEMVILPESGLAGKTLREAALGAKLDLTVLHVIRNKESYLPAQESTRLENGDVLVVEGTKEAVLQIKDTPGVEIKADLKLSDPLLTRENLALVEAIVLPGCLLVRQSLKSFGFRQRYGLQVLGLNRHGKTISGKLSQITLRVGDVLLIQGEPSKIAALEAGHAFRILGSVDVKPLNKKRALLSAGIFAGGLALGCLNVMPLAVAVLMAVVVLLALKYVTPEQAYAGVEWKAIILIASMLSFGEAMLRTGAAAYVAKLIVDLVGTADPLWLLAGFFVVTVLLTQPMSNQAAALVVFPVAVQTAIHLGLNPRAFAMMIAVAASCSYLTPLEPSCLMVYGPGGYRFKDFLRVGSLLTLIIFGLAMWLVPKYWPLALK